MTPQQELQALCARVGSMTDNELIELLWGRSREMRDAFRDVIHLELNRRERLDSDISGPGWAVIGQVIGCAHGRRWIVVGETERGEAVAYSTAGRSYQHVLLSAGMTLWREGLITPAVLVQPDELSASARIAELEAENKSLRQSLDQKAKLIDDERRAETWAKLEIGRLESRCEELERRLSERQSDDQRTHCETCCGAGEIGELDSNSVIFRARLVPCPHCTTKIGEKMNGLRPTLAHIKEDTNRAKIWREVLGGTTAPIKSPVTTRVEIDGLGMQNVYLLDVRRLNEQQLGRLVAHLSTKFKASEDFVRAQLLMDGCVPILEEDVGVSFDGRLLV